jgi:hypothetical protein
MIPIKLDEAVKIAKKYFETSFGPYEKEVKARLEGSIWHVEVMGIKGGQNDGLTYVVWVDCMTGGILNDVIQFGGRK